MDSNRAQSSVKNTRAENGGVLEFIEVQLRNQYQLEELRMTCATGKVSGEGVKRQTQIRLGKWFFDVSHWHSIRP